MKLKACGHYLIVRLEPIVEEKKYGEMGLIIAENSQERNRQQSGAQYAEVLDIGRNCWSVFTDHRGEWYQWCKPGDRIMVAKYSGQAFPTDPSMSDDELRENKLLRLIKDDDVLAVEVDDE
uniref:Co-chaperonin GroES n=1 Tax=uncultured virus TaxID=340016 RepID=A0A221S496_9VIRU|nr:co-chaperonin GroES [uncultured virus]